MPSTHSLPPSATVGFVSREAFQPLFGVKRKLWRMDDDHAPSADQAFASIRDSILKRDNYTCRFCAFKSGKFQEVHHVDDDHKNNADQNLLTVCTLCHNVHHLGLVGMKGAGFVARLPELTQTEVNHIARAYFVATKGADTGLRDRLTGLYALLRARGDEMKHAFKIDLSDPLHFAEVLSICEESLYAKRSELLKGLRLVPTATAFHTGQLDYFAAVLKPQFSPEFWTAFARKLTS